MNATSQAQHWSQHLSTTARNPVGGSNVRAQHPPPNSLQGSLENEMHRYEAERRLTLEAEQNRQYLALAANRYGAGALRPPPAHDSLSNRASSKPPPPSSTGHLLSHSTSTSTVKPASRNNPGPPPPLLRNDGSTLFGSSSVTPKVVVDPRYAHLPPQTAVYKALMAQPYDKDTYDTHQIHQQSRRGTSPPSTAGTPFPHPSVASANSAANQRGISPASSISPPDLRRTAVQLNAARDQQRYLPSSYSPGSHSQPGVTPPLSLQSRASPIGNNSNATRQRVSSPAAPGQIYGKPCLIPARSVEGRQGFSPLPRTENSLGIESNVAPPPAHGGTSSHDHHNDPRNDPRFLLTSTQRNSQRRPLHQQYLPSPTLAGSNSYSQSSLASGISQTRTDDVPLDLGVSAKRRCDTLTETEANYDPGVSPRKNLKMDSAPGVLFKVSEPSVLMTSEPSTITTVINSALISEDKSLQLSMPQNLSASQKPRSRSIPDDQSSRKSVGDSGSYCSLRENQNQTPTSKPSSPSSKDDCTSDTNKKSGYVHKLKKAWIAAYSTNDDTGTILSTGEKQSPDSQPPPTPTATRGTPSPSLSYRSSASGSSSTIAGKRGLKGKGKSHSRTSSKSEAPLSNGPSASVSPRRAGDSKGNKETDCASDASSDTGDRNCDSSGEDDAISLRSKRSASVTSGGSKKRVKKSIAAVKSTKRGRKTRTRNARNDAAMRNRKHSSHESSADEDVNTSDSSKRSDSSTNRKKGRKPATISSRSFSTKDDQRYKKEKNEKSEDYKSEKRKVERSEEKSKDQNTDDVTNPFQRPSVAQLKRTGESFLQDKPCLKEAPRLSKCLECRLTESQRNKQMPNIFCRFYAFRRLKYAKNGQVCVDGFCDPNRDYSKEDDALWNVSPSSAPKNLTPDQAKYLIENTRTDFDLIVQQERRAVELHSGEGII